MDARTGSALSAFFASYFTLNRIAAPDTKSTGGGPLFSHELEGEPGNQRRGMNEVHQAFDSMSAAALVLQNAIADGTLSGVWAERVNAALKDVFDDRIRIGHIGVRAGDQVISLGTVLAIEPPLAIEAVHSGQVYDETKS